MSQRVKLTEWAVYTGAEICGVLEGRDGAGKGGTIKAIAAVAARCDMAWWNRRLETDAKKICETSLGQIGRTTLTTRFNEPATGA